MNPRAVDAMMIFLCDALGQEWGNIAKTQRLLRTTHNFVTHILEMFDVDDFDLPVFRRVRLGHQVEAAQELLAFSAASKRARTSITSLVRWRCIPKSWISPQPATYVDMTKLAIARVVPDSRLWWWFKSNFLIAYRPDMRERRAATELMWCLVMDHGLYVLQLDTAS